MTVRVPTHDEGTALFWEFSTDSYDIAFGLFFEWNKAPEETEVSVHVSDSEDEDVDDEYLGETERAYHRTFIEALKGARKWVSMRDKPMPWQRNMA